MYITILNDREGNCETARIRELSLYTFLGNFLTPTQLIWKGYTESSACTYHTCVFVYKQTLMHGYVFSLV